MELHRTRTFPKCDLNGNAPAVSQAIGFEQGRWTLVGRRVNTISTDDALAFDIIDADNDTMSTLLTNGETQDFRCCAPSEIRAAVQPDPAADTMPSVEAPSEGNPMPSGV